MKTTHLLGPAACYDLEQSRNTEDIGFFVEAAKRIGGPVLELGCGTGRLTVPLAHAGLEVTALDISADMLMRLGERMKLEPPKTRRRINLFRADMKRFALKKKFRAAIWSSNTLLLLGSERSIGEALDCVGSHLLPDGRIIIDVAATDVEARSALMSYPGGDIPDLTLDDASGKRVLKRTHRIEPRGSNEDRAVSITYKYFDDGDFRTERREDLLLFTPDELLGLLARHGYEATETFGWYDRRPFSQDARKLIIVARGKNRL